MTFFICFYLLLRFIKETYLVLTDSQKEDKKREIEDIEENIAELNKALEEDKILSEDKKQDNSCLPTIKDNLELDFEGKNIKEELIKEKSRLEDLKKIAEDNLSNISSGSTTPTPSNPKTESQTPVENTVQDMFDFSNNFSE
jgi:coproporphyrinogen III oxidase-like Fe-S oxidoreductase